MDVKFPIGKLQFPEEITMKNVQEWLQEINTYTKRLREIIKSLTDQELEKTYREDSWNIRQLIHHISDSQLNMYQRLKLALADENPTVPPFDQDEWAILPDTKLPVESSLSMLE